MLSWLAVFFGQNNDNKNRTEQYQERENNEELFERVGNNWGAQSMEQDSDCWSHLRQSIKVKASRFSNRRTKHKKFCDEACVLQRSSGRGRYGYPSEISH
ncbi:MAG: hypothetical protein WCX16_01430 [Candidatus Omnitrophota bacterium]